MSSVDVLTTGQGPGLVVIPGSTRRASRYSAITAPTLLLGGGRSPAYLQEILPLLVDTIPNAKLITTPEFDHNAPDLGTPKAVADLIRA
jgi:hypothetical protein